MPALLQALARAALLLLLLAACQSVDSSLMSGDGVFALPGERPAWPRLRYRDGQLSRNDSCMIRMENRLNRKIPPLYVNGEPVGFC